MAYRNYSTAVSHIVDATGQGDFSTVGAALTAASSGQTIFIRPGTYTENITLKAGVNLSAFVCDALTPNVTIVGKAIFTSAGSVALSGIRLQTNSDFCLAVTGSAASIVSLEDCYINATNNTAISFTSSSSSAILTLNQCGGDVGTTGISLYASSSTGSILINYCEFSNSGGTSTASTVSAGNLSIRYSAQAFPITTSSTAGLFMQSCNIQSSPQNVIALTVNGTGGSGVIFSYFLSGSASGISVGTGATLQAALCGVNSTNTNAITGTGTLGAGIITFTGTSSTINTSTVNKFTTYGGTII